MLSKDEPLDVNLKEVMNYCNRINHRNTEIFTTVIEPEGTTVGKNVQSI